MEAISFTAESIRIINERMNWPGQRTSDGTIAAVAGMALQEVRSPLSPILGLDKGQLSTITKRTEQLLNAINRSKMETN